MNSRGCVLVVEDDDEVRDLICSVLADEGYSSLGAENGQGALALIAGNPPEVILADVRMPVMDGCAFARACRKQLGETPIIALTGAEDLSDLADPSLFDAVLNKPFNLLDLLDIVERHTTRGVTHGVVHRSEKSKQAAWAGGDR
ncbi:MAG TPA: response regulator [Chloroflexota bacterium]|nr:response regulator [Chloroflexota bacterium]